MSLTVLAIADQVAPLLYDHFSPQRWRDVDLVLSCGDLPPHYLDFLCTNLNVPVLYVRGNHDGNYESTRYDGCENVHGRIVHVKGLRVAGLQGCHLYNGGPYQYTEGQMRRMVAKLRLRALRCGAPDIVLTHAPAAGCHDGQDVCHRGFTSFLEAIRAWQPAYFVHGHTHAYNGIEPVEKIGTTTVLNAFPYSVFQLPSA